MVTQPNTYLFAGGGTGGHLTPGLAVAAELQAGHTDCRVVFVGSDRAVEQRLVEDAGYEHRVLPVESLAALRRNSIRFLWRNYRAYWQAKKLLRTEQPRAVIGLGGFASVPLVLAASRNGVPTLVLEQNIIPGRANRALSRGVDAVCLTFEESKSWFNANCPTVVTGNPVRPEIAALATVGRVADPANVEARSATCPTKDVLLILGGSQGAAGVNDAVAHLLRSTPDIWRAARIVHQAGTVQSDSLRAAYAETGLDYLVEPFFTDMAERYRAATLVISRAGATTLAELACAGCPSVLVPYPHAADNHQWHNAEHFRKAGAARLVEQSPDPSETARQLAAIVTELLSDRGKLAAMRRAMRSLARPDAARNVVQVLQTVTEGRIK